MVLGNATKKIQTIVDLAEELYEKVTVLREELDDLAGTVDETSDRVEAIEEDLDDQRALLEAVAAANDVDVDALLEESGGEPEAED